MPTNRRRRRPERRLDVQTLTSEMLRALAYGRSFFGHETTEDIIAAWEEHGDAILDRWIEEFPGTRPFAWWLCEAEGERFCLPRFNPEWRSAWETHGILCTHTIPPFQEEEEEFLRRHNELTPDEAAALDRGEDCSQLAPGHLGSMDVFADLLSTEG